jgi:ABC-2 type transport system permease protein
MALHRRRFEAYDGPLTSTGARPLLLARFALREVFESRPLLAFFVVALFPFLVLAAMVYVTHNPTARALLNMGSVFLPQAGTLFVRTLSVAGAAAFFMTAWVGPMLIAPDLNGGALPLYLSRPLSRPQYLVGKMGALLALLSAVTWIPGLVVYALESGLAGGAWWWENLWIARAVFLASWLWIALLAFVSVTASVWLRWRWAAAGALVGYFMASQAAGAVFYRTLGSSWGRILDANYLVNIIWKDLFRMSGSSGSARQMAAAGAEGLPIWAAWLALLAVCALCLLVLNKRLRAREVVR